MLRRLSALCRPASTCPTPVRAPSCPQRGQLKEMLRRLSALCRPASTLRTSKSARPRPPSRGEAVKPAVPPVRLPRICAAASATTVEGCEEVALLGRLEPPLPDTDVGGEPPRIGGADAAADMPADDKASSPRGGARGGRRKQRPEKGPSERVVGQGLPLVDPEPGVVLPPAGVSSGEGTNFRSIEAAMRAAASTGDEGFDEEEGEDWHEETLLLPFALAFPGGVSKSVGTASSSAGRR
mmetsp:Transcript_72908/g.236987  ORF Transcript_72908/g.236987 Transcript_72908/m.236987 type:complete len:239 (+) Transcript_72908:362-1078(+)